MKNKIYRLESLLLFITSIYLYNVLEQSWWLFLVVWLTPDPFKIGYLISKKAGVYLYNSAHNYGFPSALLILGNSYGNNVIIALSIIWFSRISLDRFLGHGLRTNVGSANSRKVSAKDLGERNLPTKDN